jgi:hypothetical protein
MTPPPSRHEPTARRLGSAAATALLAAALAVVGLPAAPGQAALAVDSAVDSAVERRAPSYDRFPTRGSTGVPDGWTPRRTYTRDVVVRKAGKVVEDIRIVGADLIIDAPDVTVRRVELDGGQITNVPGSDCRNGLVIEDTTLLRPTPTKLDGEDAAIGIGGYTARRVEMVDVTEGFRVGGRSMGCTRTKIVKSWVRVKYPDTCSDWHGDGIQGYDGPRLVLRMTRITMVEGEDCGGTAPFFWPHDQGNLPARVDGLLVEGGGIPFRITTPGSVQGLRIVKDSWFYRPMDVRCSLMREWEARIVRLDDRGQPGAGKRLPCNMEAE